MGKNMDGWVVDGYQMKEQTGFIVTIHVSNKTCVTGNNLVLHKALICSGQILHVNHLATSAVAVGIVVI